MFRGCEKIANILETWAKRMEALAPTVQPVITEAWRIE
jgi:hypothetical protein